MIICNLAGLMAARKINISDVSRDTGISRTTLTSLYHNTFKGIQNETLNSLCKYFNVSPDRVLLFSRYDFDADYHLPSIEWEDGKPKDLNFFITLYAISGNVKKSTEIGGTMYFYIDENKVEADICVNEFVETTDKEEEENQNFVKKVLSSLSDEFKSYLNDMILDCLIDKYQYDFDDRKFYISGFVGL